MIWNKTAIYGSALHYTRNHLNGLYTPFIEMVRWSAERGWYPSQFCPANPRVARWSWLAERQPGRGPDRTYFIHVFLHPDEKIKVRLTQDTKGPWNPGVETLKTDSSDDGSGMLGAFRLFVEYVEEHATFLVNEPFGSFQQVMGEMGFPWPVVENTPCRRG